MCLEYKVFNYLYLDFLYYNEVLCNVCKVSNATSGVVLPLHGCYFVLKKNLVYEPYADIQLDRKTTIKQMCAVTYLRKGGSKGF